MSLNLSIYETDKSNLSRAFELMQLAFAHQRNIIEPEPGIFREDSIKSLSSAIDKGEKRLIVALHRTQIMGCVLCGKNQDNPSEDFYFSRLAVRPRYQNNGIAKQLIAEVEATARSEKFVRVTCGVRKVLRQNVGMFEYLGYEIVGEGTHKGFNEPTYYKMAKVL